MIAATVAVMKENLSINKSAARYSVPRVTLQEYVKRARESLAETYERPKQPSGDLKRVMLVGDMHDSPYLPKDRFSWIGQYARDEAPDQIVQVGDMASLDSLCSHVDNSTWEGKGKPTFQMDMASLDEALERLGEHTAKIPKHVTLGNHEHRIWLFENVSPETFGMMSDELTNILKRHGWTWSRFGEYWNYSGVRFTHVPLSKMGKPMGGKTVANSAARDSVFDLCFGHTHNANVRTEAKLVDNSKVRVIEAGCALPYGYVERYAKHSLTGWDYGVWILAIRDGRIEGFKWMSMAELERRYS